jgi:hypothetical protein
MAIQNKTTIKSYFETGDTPTQAEFEDLIDSSVAVTQGTDTNTYNIRATNEGTVAGNARGEYSVDLQTDRNAATQVASGARSVIGGGAQNTASGTYSIVGGGRNNTTSGNCSTVGGGYCNTASGCNSTVGGGFGHTASSNRSTVGGGFGNTASCYYSTVGGGICNTASGYGSTVGGGVANCACDNSSTVGGGYCNTASGSFASTVGGSGNIASGYYATVGGGLCNAASGFVSTVSGGYCNTASGCCATVGGGYCNTASGIGSTVGGGYGGLADRYGQRSYAAGLFAGQGDAQQIDLIARNKTINATPTNVFLDGTSARLTITAGKALFATVNVAGIKSDGSAAAHYIRKVAIKNVGGTTALIGTPGSEVSTIGTDVEDDAGYDVTITADDTNDALDIKVTGKAEETLRWVTHIQGVEIIYGT